MTSPTLDRDKVMRPEELALVIDQLTLKGVRSINARQNLVIVTLAAKCGLRVSEVVGINMSNVHVSAKPYNVVVTKAVGKGKKGRTVPIWDVPTLKVLQQWKEEREKQGAKPSDPFVCSQAKSTLGKPLSRRNAQFRFKTALAPLGEERIERLSIHSGRHSFCSIALHHGKSLPDVQRAAGHSSVAVTSIYLHALGDDQPVDDLFAPQQERRE
jgi:site-specific recombinase XerD